MDCLAGLAFLSPIRLLVVCFFLFCFLLMKRIDSAISVILGPWWVQQIPLHRRVSLYEYSSIFYYYLQLGLQVALWKCRLLFFCVCILDHFASLIIHVTT